MPENTPQRAKGSRTRGVLFVSAAGLTLIECMLAVGMLSIAAAGMMLSTAAGVGNIEFAGTRIKAVHLAEQLLEEIVVSPYASGGADRSEWGLDDYNGLTEEPGTIRDFLGDLHPEDHQAFSRLVTVAPGSCTIPELGSITIPGKIVEVVVTSPGGLDWRISKFIPEPGTP